MGSDFRQSSKVRIMVIIDLVRFVNLCIGSLYKFSNWYWSEHNHYFYSYMCLCLIKFVFCPLLSFIPLQNSSFQFLKMVVIFDDETCSQPIADGYLCLKWVSTPCKASLNVEEFIKCFHFYFRNNTKMVIWIYLVSYLKISYKRWWVYNEYFTFIYFM